MKKIILLYTIASMVMLGSCKKYLEEDNKGGIGNADFYSTADGYKTLITASYAALRDIYGNTPELDLAGTDIYMEGRDPGVLYRYENLFPNNGTVRTFYERAYRGIQYTNAGLFFNELPTGITEQERTQYKAELQFLRAFYHFILMEQFGGVVLNTEYTNSPRVSIPRSSLGDSYQFVISEMEQALAGVATAPSAGRVTKDVVNHYLAKVHLSRGWDLNSNDDFNKAKTYADAVINAKPISIPYENLWGANGENNAEFLFTVQYSLASIKDVRSGGNSQSSLFSVYGGSGGAGMKRSTDSYVPAHHVHRNFQLNDKRYQYDFMWVTNREYFSYYSGTGDRKVFNYYPVITDPNKTQTNAADSAMWIQQLGGPGNLAPGYIPFPIWANREKYNEQVWGSTDRRLPAFKKFDSPENALNSTLEYTASVRDVVLARAAETYFLKAEACIALNQFAEARELVQKVIDRPGNKVDPAGPALTNALNGVSDKTAALEAYLIETAKEMLGEYNGRWALLRRTRMLQFMLEKYNADFDRNNIAWDDKFSYRPIPEDAIVLNDALTDADQNPGY